MSETWRPPPDAFVLPPGVIHLWRASLARSAETRQRLAQFLAPDELARASRFYFERDRQAYVVGRGLLRWLNGRYLSIPPSDIQFSSSSYGKPALAQGGDWQFNLAHSQGKLLVGFCRGAPIGVDIEQIRLPDEADALAQHYFSAAETAVFRQLPPAQRAEAFFNCWTRKEAYIKAIGEGLSCPLHSFDVTLRPGEPARLLRVAANAGAATAWTMTSLSPFPGYRGAALAAGQGWQMACWDGDLLAQDFCG
ncbi:MAG: 4'-phosphopantetheinyl transferase superfamily protein [Chloroflexi bacterium]|nr:4'-phosphopantetheinyl transferase superfamily protein [Chloroflexota bacterium]